MKAPTVKQLQAAAASIRGARSAGIETAVSRQLLVDAPAMLDAAASSLARMEARLGGSMEDWDKAGAVDAYAAAIADFRDAVGIPAPALVDDLDAALEYAVSAPAAPAAPAPAEVAFVARWDAAAAEAMRDVYAESGERIARVLYCRAAHETPSLRFGGSLGGDRRSDDRHDSYQWATRAGRWITGEAIVYRCRVTDEQDEYMHGRYVKTTATSDWLPAGVRHQRDRHRYLNTRDAEMAWDEATRDKQAADREVRRIARETPAPAGPKPATLADLAAALGGKRKRL